MPKLLLTLFTIIGLFSVRPANAEPQIEVSYANAETASSSSLKKELQSTDVVTLIVNTLNEEFVFTDSVYLVFGGEEGPHFDPNTNTIQVPYSFLEEVESRFDAANYSETGVDVDTATLDVLAHTLIHEFAHAFIFMHEIPVVGREEDAADALATVLLTEYFESGAEIAISAADMFDLESEDRQEFEEADFWDEHSLDSQRYYSTLCHVYGSNPEAFEHIPKELGFDTERAELCIFEFESIAKSWFTLLQPYKK